MLIGSAIQKHAHCMFMNVGESCLAVGNPWQVRTFLTLVRNLRKTYISFQYIVEPQAYMSAVNEKKYSILTPSIIF